MNAAELIAWGFVAHLVGDYIVQSHWMAVEKVRSWWPAALHALSYGLPFLALTRNPLALGVIVGTHAVIDRYRLARYVVWAKNQAAPKAFRPPLTATGYAEDVPPFLAVWLLIIADNTIHLAINSATLWSLA